MIRRKRIVKKTWLAVLVLMLITVTACSSIDKDSGTADNPPATDKDSAQARREEMWKYRDDRNVNQILYVTHTEGSQAIAEFYEKVPEENNAWVMVFRTDAFIGVDQMGAPDEQSGKTPLGDYGIGNAFGIRKNPGTKLNYIDVTPTTYACDEDCEYYNQIIDIKETGHDCKGEEMFKYSPEYNYGLQTATNTTNEYNKGSNLFIHCKGAKPFTMGCVGLDEEYMITVLQKADPGMRVYYSEMYL
jgi:L,D-peptidoglycan transpeptidase YkuD (ErfK/YbiS/YcfS/YnhG family)